jgi:hypothetical protein
VRHRPVWSNLRALFEQPTATSRDELDHVQAVLTGDKYPCQVRTTTEWPYAGLGDPSWLAGDPADDALRAARAAVLDVLSTSGADARSRAGLLAALGAVADLQERLDWALLALVGEGRAARLSWAELGAALGVSRQAAQQRFAAFVEQALEQARAAADADPP